MEDIFKEDDRVYLNLVGWGTIIDVTDYDISVKFDTGDVRHISGDVRRLLSFTEYTLEGFSQERPEELPKKGDIVWLREEFPSVWKIGHFMKKLDDIYYASVHLEGWSHRGTEIRTTNPYANEHN